MEIRSINASMLAKMFLAGAARLEADKEWINQLNVFPVPDGDTGSNMTMTIMSAAQAVAKLENPTMAQLSKTMSSGALRGARGNSGVILSQLIRGFGKEIEEVDEIDARVIAKAANRAVSTAYKAVMKPKEGTILTVAKGMSEKAIELRKSKDLTAMIKEIIAYGDKVLEHTPDLLPVLKEAGVVDSGGQGLMQVLKGMYDCLTGKETPTVAATASAAPAKVQKREKISTDDITFGYCTEFIVLIEAPISEEQEDDFKAYLTSIGDSIVCVADDDYIKVHVHTNDPGLAIQKGLTFGQLTNMKIDNMREEHEEVLFDQATMAAAKEAEAKAEEEKAVEAPAEPPKKYGFIAVSMGEGMSTIAKDLGVDMVIEGGQTMNPSTDDFMNAIDKINAENIFVFPNNGNIILAASQAASITEDKNIIVIPTKSVPQCFSAMIFFAEEEDVDANQEAMMDAITHVKTGQVTYAVRDTSISGIEIHDGDIMGICDGSILTAGEGIENITLDLVSKMVDEDSEVISVFFGEDIDEDAAGELAAKLEEQFPDCDVELQNGGQPVYYYVISVE